MNVLRSRHRQNEGKVAPVETSPVDAAKSKGTSNATEGAEGTLFPKTTKKNKPRRLLQTFGARMLAKGTGIAVAAAMLGTMLGAPEASNRQADGAPMTEVVYQQPTGTEVSSLANAVTKVTEMLAPLGVSEREAVDALEYATFSVELEGGTLLEGNLQIEPGTRLAINIHRNGVSIDATPAMTWNADWVPDPEVRRLSYSFDSGTFTADAEGFGPDGWYESAVESAASGHLKRFMPPAMQEPGYDPWTDPDLERHVQGIVDLLKSSGVSNAAGDSAVSAPRLSLSFTVPRTLRVDLPNCDYSAWLDAGTRLYVSLSLEGSVSDPRLESLDVRFSGHPMEVSEGTERDAVLHRMDVDAARLLPGGEVELDYELGSEQAVDGVRALFTLIAIAAEPRLAHGAQNMERSRHDGLRDGVQARIDDDVEPAIVELVRANDGAIPGVSLVDVLGIGDR